MTFSILIRFSIVTVLCSWLHGCGGAASEDSAESKSSPSSVAVGSSGQVQTSQSLSSSSSDMTSEFSSNSSSSIINSSLQTSTSKSSYQRVSKSSSSNSSIDGTVPDKSKLTAPGRPEPVILEARSVTLKWEPSISEAGITAYKIYKNGFPVIIVDGNVTQHKVDYLVPQETYNFFVVAIDALNEWSEASEIVTVETPSEPILSSSSQQSVASSSDISSSTSSIPFSSFASVSSSSLSTISSSSAKPSSSSAPSSSSFTSSSSSFVGSSKSSSSLSSSFSSGKSSSFAVSSSSSAPDLTPPTKPSALKASQVNQTSLRIDWEKSTDNIGVVKYEITRDGVLIATVDLSVNYYQDSGLSAGTVYKYKVFAFDAQNNVRASDELITSTSPAKIPGMATLTWNHPNARENGAYLSIEEIGGYEIRYKKPLDPRFTYIRIDGNKTTEYSAKEELF